MPQLEKLPDGLEDVLQQMDNDIEEYTNINDSYIRNANILAYSLGSTCHNQNINSHKDILNITCGKCNTHFDVLYGDMMAYGDWCPKCPDRNPAYIPKESIKVICTYLAEGLSNKSDTDERKDEEKIYIEYGDEGEDICYMHRLFNNRKKYAVFVYLGRQSYQEAEDYLAPIMEGGQTLIIPIPYQISKMGIGILKNYILNKMQKYKMVTNDADLDSFKKDISSVSQKLIRRIWKMDLYMQTNIPLPKILDNTTSSQVPIEDTNTAIAINVNTNYQPPIEQEVEEPHFLDRKVATRDFSSASSATVKVMEEVDEEEDDSSAITIVIQSPSPPIEQKKEPSSSTAVLLNFLPSTTPKLIADLINSGSTSHNYDNWDIYVTNADKQKCNESTVINIKCLKHDISFQQSISGHKAGTSECKFCKNSVSFMTLAAKNKSASNYDLSKSIYYDGRRNAKIFCKTHGLFSVSPRDFLNEKSLCPNCVTGGVSISDIPD